jgi:beta-1,4-mannosyltransferase
LTVVRVLEMLTPPEIGVTRYVNQIVDHAPDDLEFTYFSWSVAFRHQYDVFHIHWPEHLARSSDGKFSKPKALVARALITLLRARGTRIVRTLHNMRPHEKASSAEERFLTWLDDNTDAFISINDAPIPEAFRPLHRIPHGHYVDKYARYDRSAPVASRCLFFGQIRPYKGVVELLEQFKQLPDAQLSLHVVGNPLTSDYQQQIEVAAGDDERVTLAFGFMPDERLCLEITAAELVVLPYLEMENSGALLLALSLGRPVLVPASPTTVLLRDEVGDEFILTYDGDLDSVDIASSLVKASATVMSGKLPDLKRRDWSTVAAQHAEVYRSAVSLGA